MGREKARKKGERKRKHSHRSRREESESESSDEDISTGSSSESEESESETESSSSSEEEERERRKRKKKKMKRRRSSEGSSTKLKGKSKKKRHTSHKKKKKKIEEISIDDYFRKSVEFRTWLSEERKIFFSDLTSQQSRELFKKFAKEWNSQALHKKYYKGLESATLEHRKQTGHIWKFSRSLSKDELTGVKKSVSSWTAGGDAEPGRGGGGASQIGPRLPSAPSTSAGVMKGPMIGPSLPGGSVAMEMNPDPHLAEERRREEWERVRRGRKEMRKQQELVMDELLPKATGKEARFEKKKIRAEKRRDREISPDVAESTLMGPKTDIQQKIQNRQAQRQNRAHAAAERVAEIQAKEKSRMQALMEMAKANKKEGALW